MAKSSGDRRRSARLLIRVEDGAFASRLLEREVSPGVRVRVLGVLRWQRALDHLLEPFLKRQIARLDPEVRTVLRLGCFEMHQLGVPAPVATDSMIRLTRRLGKSSAAGMVNAVLRRVAAGGDVAVTPDLRWSHPEWLWRLWADNFGFDEAVGAAKAATEPAPPWVWSVDGQTLNGFEDPSVVLVSHPWCPETWTATEGRSELMGRIREGGVIVQDPSSQMVARIAVSAVGGRGHAADLCAAPGGKTALMRKLGRWDLLVAADVSPAKALRLDHRLGDVLVAVADAGRPVLRPRAWDLVLLDAPCSGTGTFRRHPELKWRLTPEAIAEAAQRQRPMIDAALDLLAPGGILVYATCSVEPDENERHFQEVPVGFDPLELDDFLPESLPWTETDAGGVRILPHEDGDGFTVHAVSRRE